MNHKYFRLFPHCEVNRGPCRSVVYDMARGISIHLTELQTNILDQCERNTSIEQIIGAGNTETENVLEEITQLNIGMFYDGPVYVEKLRLNSPIELPGLLEPPPFIPIVYLQITTDCNLQCDFCGDRDYLAWLGCNSCVRWSPSGNDHLMDQAAISNLISELSELEAMSYSISGGNPLMRKELLKYVVEEIRRQQHFPAGIRIHTNGMGLDDDFLAFARDAKLGFNFSLFGNSSSDYAHLGGKADAFEEIRAAIRLCQDYQIPTATCVVLPPHSSVPWVMRKEAATELGSSQVLFTEFVSKRDSCVSPVSSVPVNRPRETEYAIDYYHFRKRYNVCFGVMAIDSNLKLRPCPMIGPIADLHDTTIHDVLREGKLQPFWRYTKSQVPVCKDCEFRGLCADCSLIEREIEKTPQVRAAICGYDPYTGLWPSDDIPLTEEAYGRSASR